MNLVYLATILVAVALAQTTVVQQSGTATPTEPASTFAPEWNQSCTKDTRCEEDLFQCQASSCNLTTFRCQRRFVQTDSACYDWMNETNWDTCEFGVCVGSRRRSTFVEFNTTEGQLDLTTDGSWAQNARKAVVEFLGMDTELGQPYVRSCFELNQQPSCSLAAFSRPTTVIQRRFDDCMGCPEDVTCTVDTAPNCVKPTEGKNYTLWFEFVDGPDHKGDELARRVIAEVNGNPSSSLHGAPAYLYEARVSVSPFFRKAAVPSTQEYYLGIEIGVACGLFLIAIFVCFVGFAIKANRDVEAFSGTDSAASMQSSADSTASQM